MIAIIVNALGAVLIALIIWWFWLSSPADITKVTDLIEIVVKDGIYQPAYLEIKLNHPVVLRFIRKDPSPCAEVVVFSDLNISEQLPLNQAKDIIITFDRMGDVEFTCQMGMYRGKITVI